MLYLYYTDTDTVSIHIHILPCKGENTMTITFDNGYEKTIIATTKAEFISLLSTVTDVIIDRVEYAPENVTEDILTPNSVGYTSGRNIYYDPAPTATALSYYYYSL